MKNNLSNTLFAAALSFFSLALLIGVYSITFDFNQTETSLEMASKKSSFEDSQSRLTILGQKKDIKTKTIDESSVIINDPAIKQKWGLISSDVKRAWTISQGSRDVIVAVIDTGVDVQHEDLKNNLWTNQGETGLDINGRDKASNGIDDDKNGFIDDVHGWNFVNNSNNLTDNHGHGSHIAGIIGAEGGNNKGVSGIAPKVSLMILKYYDPQVKGSDNLKNTIRAIRYATKMNAQIINYSGGGLEYSHEEFRAIKAAGEKNILFVAAAGNEKSNSDQKKYFPANYDLNNIISVTAINPKMQVLASSNYGVQTVDIAAPGENILSTFPGNNYGYLTGTSQATSFVSGAAAVFKANNPEISSVESIKKFLLQTGDTAPQLISKTGTSKRLNLFKALTTLDQGISLTGVIAENTANMKMTDFSSNPLDAINSMSSEAQTTVFGKTLIKMLKTSN